MRRRCREGHGGIGGAVAHTEGEAGGAAQCQLAARNRQGHGLVAGADVHVGDRDRVRAAEHQAGVLVDRLRAGTPLTGASLTLATPIEKVCVLLSAPAVACTVMSYACPGAVSKSIAAPFATVTTPVFGVDGKPAARTVGQRVGRRRAAARIGRRGGNADDGAVGGALEDGVGGAVGIGRRRRSDVGNADRECRRRGQRAVGRLHGDAVGMPGRGLEIDRGAVGDRDNTGARINGKPAAGTVGQRISGRRSVRIDRRRSDADG